ncbi:tetratricopeptide repeat protein [Myxococcus sp. AM009]|uniref:tetratricopeptide repeat protein n=1 Tax=unclassified Myxococcus TaxID=2648731 RepID=UPI001595CED2|nr:MULTISPECIES: tetratricopeptide repeat protein [unclassified Myxococcus]NVI97770.1 tetratricopeptide repeat protein [Myxococcus sp. AM009]NVJ15850.1 tetratricopeptide repeat protein [Myxococcus sp. AM010]
MQPQTTNWLPGIIVLAATFVLAAGWLLLQRRKGALASAEPRDGVLDDLTQRAQSLIDQLRALDAEKHNQGAEQYAAEKSRLEREAAAALRAKDEHLKRKASGEGVRARPQAPAPTGWASRNPQLVGALWGAGIVVFFGGLGYLLVSEQQTRTDGMEATGRMPPGGAAAQPQGAGMGEQMQEGPEMQEARARLNANAGDVDAAALLSHELIRRQQFDEAVKVTAKGLAADPFNVELKVHRGVLRATQGDMAGAEAELTELVDTWPDAQEALIFLGSLALRRGDKATALAYFERFSVEVPRNMQPPQLGPAIAQLRAEVAGGMP